MTVLTTTAKAGPYAGAGTTGPFTVPFRFLDAAHLRVIRTALGVETVLVLGTDYTVSGVGGSSGSVTLTAPLPVGQSLTVVRSVPATQEADYVPGDAFPAESHEEALDKLTMLVQQNGEELGRSLRLPASAAPGVSTQLPSPQANRLIGWNAGANGLQNLDPGVLATLVAYGTAKADSFTGDGVTTAFNLTEEPGSLNNLDVSVNGLTLVPVADYNWISGTVVTFTAPPANGAEILIRYMQGLPFGTSDAADVRFLQAGAGAVPRTAQAKLREFAVSVKDYGAVGDGVTDDRAAINLAFAEVIARGSGTVYFPAGTYRCTGTIGNVSGATNRISIAVIGEAGAVISFDPAVAANVGLDLRFDELNIGIVKNLEIRCNNKVATGLRVRGIQTSPTAPVDLVYIDSVQVSGCKMVDNPSITTAAAGISTSSSLGVTCWVTNCYVVDVSRDKLSFSTGIEATGFITTFIANNAIFNVTHGGITPLQDADGIKVFSFNDGAARYYRQSTATIINNRVVNCDGRFIKLQTNGNAVVENNVLSLTADMQLITNFQFIDSQVGSATISHNKIQALSNWTGGASSSVFSIQFANATNFFETNESFVQRVENNDVYITKRFAYGVTADLINASQCNVFYYIKQNTISSDIPLELTGNVLDAAVGRFVYLSGGATLAGFTGKLFLDISDNRVSSSAGLLSVANTSNDDFADKWFWYIYDNFIYTWTGGDVVVTSGGASPLNNCAYTSTLMVRDNNVGSSSAIRNRLRLPLNVSKILSGSDFETGDGAAPAMTNVPANWRSGRIYKKGLISGVETLASGPTAVHYLSADNGANWYQV